MRAATSIPGATTDTQDPDVILYPVLHIHKHMYGSELAIQWAYVGRWLVLHSRHGASALAVQRPRYCPAGHDEVEQATQDTTGPAQSVVSVPYAHRYPSSSHVPSSACWQVSVNVLPWHLSWLLLEPEYEQNLEKEWLFPERVQS